MLSVLRGGFTYHLDIFTTKCTHFLHYYEPSSKVFHKVNCNQSTWGDLNFARGGEFIIMHFSLSLSFHGNAVGSTGFMLKTLLLFYAFTKLYFYSILVQEIDILTFCFVDGPCLQHSMVTNESNFNGRRAN